MRKIQLVFMPTEELPEVAIHPFDYLFLPPRREPKERAPIPDPPKPVPARVRAKEITALFPVGDFSAVVERVGVFTCHVTLTQASTGKTRFDKCAFGSEVALVDELICQMHP